MSKYVFGVDIGGTTVKLGFFDVEGNLLDKWEIPTRKEDGGSKILPDVADSIKEKMAKENIDKSTVAGVGVGVPGPVDNEGIVHKAVNLGWSMFSVSEVLGALLDMPVKAGNDANVAALGEMWRGSAQGNDDVVMITLGTGVGGGIIVNGKLINGSTGAGGEVGHIHVDDNEEECCGCGNKGCLEQYASATGIVRLANRKLASTNEDTVLRSGEVSAKTVFDAVKAGDKVACEIADEFADYLGKGLSVIADVVNPEVICIGGGVSKAGQVIIDLIEPVYQKHVFHGSRGTKFVLATLGNDAGIYGSAKLVLD